ncbi:NAD(P)H-dependent oxidoreductase subunit E, partial [Pseudomonas aeruginosa]|uniref:NAD(P)H-dependent oxidoreductase subunit E n=1 Tax=Pseudomonas aeruginosa TaxID=287 RepID=UPI00066D015C
MSQSNLIQTDRFVLSETERSSIEHEMHHYEDPRAASIEALKIVQKQRGWVPDGAIPAIGEVLEQGPARQQQARYPSAT